MSEEHWLRELLNAVCCTNAILERIADSLEWIEPQDNERDRIALQLFIHNPHVEADAAFRQADAWLCERDDQELQQAEHDAQPTV